MLKKYIKVLALKLYASARCSGNQHIRKFDSDSLVDNRRVPSTLTFWDKSQKPNGASKKFYLKFL